MQKARPLGFVCAGLLCLVVMPLGCTSSVAPRPSNPPGTVSFSGVARYDNGLAANQAEVVAELSPVVSTVCDSVGQYSITVPATGDSLQLLAIESPAHLRSAIGTWYGWVRVLAQGRSRRVDIVLDKMQPMESDPARRQLTRP